MTLICINVSVLVCRRFKDSAAEESETSGITKVTSLIKSHGYAGDPTVSWETVCVYVWGCESSAPPSCMLASHAHLLRTKSYKGDKEPTSCWWTQGDEDTVVGLEDGCCGVVVEGGERGGDCCRLTCLDCVLIWDGRSVWLKGSVSSLLSTCRSLGIPGSWSLFKNSGSECCISGLLTSLGV